MSRMEITSLLRTICPNVFLTYPEVLETYPCIIYKFEQTGKGSHESIEYYDQSLNVEIYSETSEERGVLEIELIELLFENGWLNISSSDMSNEDHYRQVLRFERNN